MVKPEDPKPEQVELVYGNEIQAGTSWNRYHQSGSCSSFQQVSKTSLHKWKNQPFVLRIVIVPLPLVQILVRVTTNLPERPTP